MLHFASFLLAGGATVTLNAEARVRGAEIELGEVATIACADAALAERLGALSLGWAPAPGYARTLRADRLAADLARLAPEVEIALAGALACSVAPQTEQVRGEAIEAAARRELERSFAGRDAELVLARAVSNVEVPGGARPCVLEAALDPRAVRVGVASVPVRVIVDGEPYRTVWTEWKVETRELRAVLTRALRAGETIGRGDVETRRVRVVGARAGKLLDLERAIGSVAARDLAAGAALDEADVVRPQIVARGDALTVEVRRGSVAARAAAVASEAGRAGDRVRIVLTGSGRTLTATLVSRDLAVVEMDAGTREER
jgi:flagella basal body P-ring formation protein FlgA